jgi:thiamine-phosphate pyrophosphorylase
MRLDLYLVTDPELSGARPLLQIVAAAMGGGVTVVQLRDKKAFPRELLLVGAEIRRITRQQDASFIVNDRADLALALGADGVHVGPADLPPLEARRLMPPPLRVGVSVGGVAEALSAERAGADYLGAGPVFSTLTKRDAGAPIGLEGVAAIAASVAIPVVGIGGIDEENAASVIAAGARGVAVISAIIAAEDPEARARQILARVREALSRRKNPLLDGEPERKP